MMDDRSSIKFESRLPGVVVNLSREAISIIEQQALASPENETGGILIGRYDYANDRAVVLAATQRPTDSEIGRTWFRRGSSGLKQLLRERWKSGEYYVGEWHSHPGGSPEPSSSDVREMRAISRNPVYACSKPILIIAGTVGNSVSLSVSVMEAGLLVRFRTQRYGHTALEMK